MNVIKEIEQWTRVAYHEAGHAVVAAALNCPTRGVYIANRPPVTDVRPRKSHADVDEARRHIAINFAGYLAERRACPEDRAEALRGASGDFVRMNEWLGVPPVRMYFAQEGHWRAFVREQARMANHILRINWRLVDELATELLCGEDDGIAGRRLARQLRRVRAHPLPLSPAIRAAAAHMMAA